MKGQFREERERMDKLNEAFLYNIGYEHVNNICEEADRLLEEYKDIEIPKSLNDWFFEYEKKHDRKIKGDKIRKKSLQISKRVAMILLVIIVASAVVTMSVEACRIRFFNMITETHKQFSSVKFKEDDNVEYIDELPVEWEDFYYPMILPQGYELKRAFDANRTKYIVFINSEMEELYFVQGLITSDFQLDSENGYVMEVEVNGMEGLIIEKEGRNIINWHDNNHSYYIQGNVEKSMIMKIAESVIKK